MKSVFLSIYFTLAVIGRAAESGSEIQKRLDTIVLPRFQFRAVAAESVLGFLRDRYQRSAPGHLLRVRYIANPGDLPGFIPLVFPTPTPPADKPLRTEITISLVNVRVGDALRFVTSLMDCDFSVRGEEILIFPRLGTFEPLITREFRGGPPPGLERAELKAQPKLDFRRELSGKGVRFFGNCLADYYPAEMRTVIRTTRTELDKFEVLLPIQ